VSIKFIWLQHHVILKHLFSCMTSIFMRDGYWGNPILLCLGQSIILWPAVFGLWFGSVSVLWVCVNPLDGFIDAFINMKWPSCLCWLILYKGYLVRYEYTYSCSFQLPFSWKSFHSITLRLYSSLLARHASWRQQTVGFSFYYLILQSGFNNHELCSFVFITESLRSF
jgi:hypothetical protein